jgi:hypothetical protein
MRNAVWAIAIGSLGVMLAALLFRLVAAPGAVFVVVLIWCVALIAALAALVAQVPPQAGAAGGVFAAALVAVVLAMTIAAAPLAPGATRPGLRDLLWLPLFAVAAVVALCAMAGFYGARLGHYMAKRRKA